MAVHYDLKAIGDQVHRLTLQLEAEKFVTDFIIQRMCALGHMSAALVDRITDNMPTAKDDEAELFLSIIHARLLDLHRAIAQPPKAVD